MLKHGCGGLNIDAGRIEGTLEGDPTRFAKTDGGSFAAFKTPPVVRTSGRWPANVALSHTPDCGEHCAPGCAVAMLDAQSGVSKAGVAVRHNSGGNTFGGDNAKPPMPDMSYKDTGGASRYFYCAKASRSERNAGLEGFKVRDLNWSSGTKNPGSFQAEGTERAARNYHPTVKPISLMRWLVRLVTRPGGLVLDPFAGSGTTCCAAVMEGVHHVGIEQDGAYAAIARARIAHWAREYELPLFAGMESDNG